MGLRVLVLVARRSLTPYTNRPNKDPVAYRAGGPDDESRTFQTPFDRTRKFPHAHNSKQHGGCPRFVFSTWVLGLLLTLLFAYSSPMRRGHSPALIAVQPSFSTFHCKILNNFSKACYSLPCISNPILARLTFPQPLIPLPPVLRTLFQVPHPVSPAVATLTKTAGVCTNNSHSGTHRQPSNVQTISRPIPFLSTLLRTLLRFLAHVQNSTLFFSCDSALFRKIPGVRGRSFVE